MDRVCLLVVGDADHGEFRDALAWLDEHTELARAATIPAALSRLAAAERDPEAIVFAQARPGVFDRRSIEELHREAPLSRLVALLGSWCEGEVRSGFPWPGVERVYWHQWSARGPRELLGGSLDHGRSTWSLPRTTTAAERALFAAESPWPAGQGLVAIHTDQLASFEALADACQNAGYCSVWLSPSRWPRFQAVSAVLWDGVCCNEENAAIVRGLSAQTQPAPLVALLDYVRLDDHQRALEAGAAAVIAKPFALADLFGLLERLLTPSASGRNPAPAA